jgi:hypothetical protein
MDEIQNEPVEGLHRRTRYHFTAVENGLCGVIHSLKRIRELHRGTLPRSEEEWTSDLEVIRGKLDEVKRALDEL